MNDQTDHNLHAPVEGPDPAKAADELLSHGLLTFIHRDPPAETERRMKGVMRRIADEAPHGAHERTARRRMVFPHARRWIGLAACFVIAAGLVYLGLPGESTAQAMVRASAATLREPGDRRFEIRVQPRGSKELLSAPVGTIDSRGPGLMVMRLQPEEGVWVTFGRDPAGPWLVHPDGRLERNPPAGAMPRWGSVNDQPIAPDRVDHILEDLANAYTLVSVSEKDADGSVTEHITGVRRPEAGPGAPKIDLWIDSGSKAVRKVELMFPDPPSRGAMGGGQRGPGGPEGPRGERGPRPIREGDGPGGPGGRDDGAGRPDKGPPSSRDFDRMPPPPGGRDGREGRGPDDFDGRGPGGPGGGRGFRGAPLRIELRPVPPPPLDPAWFTPEKHARKA